MRRRLLQGLNAFFKTYVLFIVMLWSFWILLDLVLGFVVFPTAKGGIWYIGLGGTLGCAIGFVGIGILKAFFHKRVIQSLDNQKGSDA